MQAKVILGMDPAQSLDDVTIQTIHDVFTAKLQEVRQASADYRCKETDRYQALSHFLGGHPGAGEGEEVQPRYPRGLPVPHAEKEEAGQPDHDTKLGSGKDSGCHGSFCF